jgi:hypothetical protein
MCVIIIAQKRLPTTEELRSAWVRNEDGAGVAWIERGKVKWVKGLMSFNDVVELLPKVKLPCVWHFRSATHGGVSQALTHPFLISPKAPFSNPLKGALKTGEALLFHNGVEGQAIHQLLQLLVIKGMRLNEQVSDTRAIAIIIALVGECALSMFSSKFVLFRSDGSITIKGQFHEEDGLLVSSPLKWEVDFVRWTRRYGGYGLEL